MQSLLADLPEIPIASPSSKPAIDKTSRAAFDLYKKLQLSAATAVVVDVTHSKSVKVSLMSVVEDDFKAPALELARKSAEHKTLENEAKSISDAASSLLREGRPLDSLKSVGTLRIPPGLSESSGRFTVPLTPCQFANMHAFVAS